MNDSNLLQTLGQVSSESASKVFNNHRRRLEANVETRCRSFLVGQQNPLSFGCSDIFAGFAFVDGGFWRVMVVQLNSEQSIWPEQA